MPQSTSLRHDTYAIIDISGSPIYIYGGHECNLFLRCSRIHFGLTHTGEVSMSKSSILRPALAELPARPLNQRPKLASTKTSPTEAPQTSANQTLTPPSTPPRPGNIRASISTDGIEARLSAAINHQDGRPRALDAITISRSDECSRSPQTELKLCHKKYQLHEELGRGVWSNVYAASEVCQPAMSDIFPFSPPSSPIGPPSSIRPKSLAVKKPSRRDGMKVLEKEAKILTSLHSDEQASSYIVLFHGFDAVNQSIVLDSVPLNLEVYVKSARQRPLSTKTMFDPIIGAEQWTNLVDCLISGLTFLHSRGCVHGDIKPANILLQLDPIDKITPLYCDFSSSRITTGTPLEEAEEVSAVTADYTSPELLEALHKRNNGRAVATFASDIFALAVTLLFAATAESPYACARMDFQRLGMAKEGTPLEYARRGEQASRIMKGRAVERALRDALAKEPEKRLTVEEWKAAVQDVSKNWAIGGWSRGG